MGVVRFGRKPSADSRPGKRTDIRLVWRGNTVWLNGWSYHARYSYLLI
jgi:hypothetical protein